MKAVGSTIVQAVILINIGIVIGLGANAVRGRGHIDLCRDYHVKVHKTIGSNSGHTPGNTPSSTSAPAPTTAEQAGPATANASADEAAAPLESAPSVDEGSSGGNGDELYHVIGFDEVAAIVNDGTRVGADVFIDARDDGPFHAGHIPGAVQYWPYEGEYYIEQALSMALPAERVILYCNGGECEDSHFAAQELLTNGVSPAQIYIYEGGWEEWSQKGMPIEKDPQ